MSYILDALKKSEKARGGRKPSVLLEPPADAPFLSSQSPRSSRRWQYLVATILFMVAGFFVLWIRTWQPGSKVSSLSRPVAGGHTPDTMRQAMPGMNSQPPAQLADEHKAIESRPAERVNQTLSPSVSGIGQIASAGPPATESLLGDRNQDHDAVQKSKAPKAPQKSNAAGAKKDAKGSNLQEVRKKPAPLIEQRARQAKGGEIISDMLPLSKLDASQDKPATHRVPTWQELDPQVRDSMPKISVSMLIYSQKPEQRWININGSKRREGEEFSADLRVEEITRDGAILTYRGTRFYKAVIGE